MNSGFGTIVSKLLSYPTPPLPTPFEVQRFSSGSLGVVTLLWNKLDKRFDDLKAEQNRRFDKVDKQLDKLQALLLEALKTPR